MPDRSSDPATYISVKNGNGTNDGKINGTYLYAQPAANSLDREADSDSIDLRQLTSIVKHRLRLISAVAFGVTALTAIFTFTQESKYQGSFQLLVEPVSEDQANPFADNPLAILQQDFGGLDYDTQIEVLQSPQVMQPIISKLARKYPELEYDELIKPKKSPLKIDQIDQTKILEVSLTDADPNKIQFVLDNLADAYLKYSLEEKRAEVEQGVEFVERQLPEVRQRVDKLEREVQAFRQTYNLLNPEQQATLLASQQVSFDQKLFETKSKIKETKSLYALLEQQLGLQPQQALAASYLSESPRYQNLLNELQTVEVELAQESARFSDQNPAVINLQEKRSRLLELLQQEANGVLGQNLTGTVNNSPNLTSPSSLRLELNQQYIQAANELEILQVQQQALEEGVAEIKKLIIQMPVIARQYANLTRELTVATESLTRFMTAKEELQLQGAQQALPWRAIAKPKVLEDRVSPNPPRNLILGLASGILLGIGAALLAERLDPVFHSAEELKESINFPVLGLIPLVKDLKPAGESDSISVKKKFDLPQLQIGNTPLNVTTPEPSSSGINTRKQWQSASPFLEAFRSLHTNTKLLGSDNSICSLVISSSVPSEGKSTVSCHLAQAAAAMGQKVLIVDADLRRPQVHHWMGVENQEGLSNILATGFELESAVINVPQWENLSVITAGDIPPDPTRLLSSQKMYSLMEQIKKSGKYDLIIYDTPPILGFADGRILATRTDGVVLVVKIGKTDRSLLKQNIDNIKMSKVPILGVVANHVSSSSNSSHYYSHYYTKK